MAANTNRDEIGVQPLNVKNWALGINTSAPGTDIADNEAQDILNFEFDDAGDLASRVGVTNLTLGAFPTRITSLYYFVGDAGEVGVLVTSGAQLYIFQVDGSGFTDITGGLGFPSDTFWQWVTYQGIAIGVNGRADGSGNATVKVEDDGTASALGGMPPPGKYIELWNDRIWIASATEPNTLYASKLGNPEDWTVSGDDDAIIIDVDAGDGDRIMGLIAHKGALYVFKRKSIHRVLPISNTIAPTVASNLKVDRYAKGIGCVSGYSIKAVLDDVVFLSEVGLASLTLSQTVEDFRTALYSQKVAEIFATPKISDEIPGFVLDTASQYWLTFPDGVSLLEGAQTFVLDYLYLNEGVKRWTRFDGLVSGTAYEGVETATGKKYFIGAPDGAGNHGVYLYEPRSASRTYSDDGAAYVKRLRTKAYSIDLPLVRKEWHKWGFGFDLLTQMCQVAVQYYFNGATNRGGAYAFNLQASGDEALWDEALWDEALWDAGISIPADVIRKLKVNSSGRRSQNITFLVTNAQDEQGFIIKHFILWYSMLSEILVSEI